MYIPTKLLGVTSHNVHTYKTTRRHIQQHCTNVPNCMASHPTMYIPTKLHGVTSNNIVHIYQIARRHIPQCTYLPNCTASHPTMFILPNYTASHPTTLHTYQTARRHIPQCTYLQTTRRNIPQHCTHPPDYTASHPTTMYISTKLHGVTSHNTVAVIKSQLTLCQCGLALPVLLMVLFLYER
jgi:hypothetical protein